MIQTSTQTYGLQLYNMKALIWGYLIAYASASAGLPISSFSVNNITKLQLLLAF